MKIPRRDGRNGALLTLLCVLAYLPAMAGLLQGGWPFVDDGVTLFNIWHELANRGLKNGVVPLWNHYIFCGLPFFANNQSAVLYPPNFLYLFIPMPLALLVDAVLHNIALAIGAYFLGRVMHLSRTGSFIVALAFGLGGGVAAHIYNGHMTWHAVRVYLPWELAFLLLYLRRGQMRFAVLLAVCFALQVAAGYPPLVLVSATLCAGLFFIWVATHHRLPSRWLSAVVLCGTLAGLLSAIYILPLAEMSRQSVHGDALTYSYASALSGSWKTLVRLLLPGVFGNNADLQWSIIYTPHEEVGFVGVLPLLLAIGAPFWAYKSGNRRAIWLAWCLLPFAIAMAMGRHLSLYRWIFEIFPPLRQTRVPARWMEIFYYGAAILAGIGFDHLIRYRRCEPRVEKWVVYILRALCAAFIVLLVVIVLTPSNAPFWMHTVKVVTRKTPQFADADELWRSAMVETLIGAAFVGAMAFLWNRWSGTQQPKQAHHLRLLMLVLVTLDLTGYFWRSAKIAPLEAVRAQLTLPVSLTKLYKPQERWDTKVSYNMMNHCILHGIDTFTGYDALGSRRYFEWVRKLEKQPLWGALYEPSRRTPLQRVAGVTHTLTSPKATVPRGSKEFPDYKPQLIADSGEFKLWQWDGAWPRAYLTRNAMAYPEKEQLDYLEKWGAQKRDPKQAWTSYPATVETSRMEVADVPMSKGEGLLNWKQSFDRVNFKTRATHPSVLVFADANYPGWRAFANGKPAYMETANFLFRGVEVPAGDSEIEMVYEPQSFRIGLFLSLCGLSSLGFLATLFTSRKSLSKRRRPSTMPN